jgi:murein DD-endopeptidase MepM/ murein hydrolase activator NlpD
VHLPSDTTSAPETPEVSNAHHDRAGKYVVYDQIPRRPDRPADYDAYEYPIPPGMPGGRHVMSGYDLDQPDSRQRRGRHLSHVGHGGVDLPQKMGTPIRAIALEHQEGPSEVLFIGWLFGKTVITRHSLREGDRSRDYVLLFGHLDAPADGLVVGQQLADGDPIGTVGNTSSVDFVHLHLEARRVRDDIDLKKLAPGLLIANEVSVVCDPRNVLPLKAR